MDLGRATLAGRRSPGDARRATLAKPPGVVANMPRQDRYYKLEKDRTKNSTIMVGYSESSGVRVAPNNQIPF